MIDLTNIGRVTSPFGFRESPTAGASTNHKGLDIVLTSDNIPAVKSGTVTAVGYNSSAGNYITIKQVDGTTASYKHLANRPTYKVGASVLEGSTVGIQGTTGISTGKHLHLSIQDSSGTYIDPAKYMSGGTLEHANFDTVSNDSGVSGIMGAIANFVAMLLLCVFAVVLFLKAFDISII